MTDYRKALHAAIDAFFDNLGGVEIVQTITAPAQEAAPPREASIKVSDEAIEKIAKAASEPKPARGRPRKEAAKEEPKPEQKPEPAPEPETKIGSGNEVNAIIDYVDAKMAELSGADCDKFIELVEAELKKFGAETLDDLHPLKADVMLRTLKRSFG